MKIALSVVVALYFFVGSAIGAEKTMKEEDVLADILKETPSKAGSPSPWSGSLGLRGAYTFGSPSHLSSAAVSTEVSRKITFGGENENKGKVSVRCEHDFAYHSHFYPEEVRRDQRSDCMVGETYIDVGVRDWDLRLGRQHIVWGEVPGMAIADVVSAWDTRFAPVPLPSLLKDMRIPQWAALAERFTNDVNFSLLVVPYASVNRIGKPGADFYPYPVTFPALYLGEEKPQHTAGHVNYGVRAGYLFHGWDTSLFYYRSTDVAPTFYRVSAPLEPLVFQPRHDRIHQVGGTFSKEVFGNTVIKGEGVMTSGRKFPVIHAQGVVPLRTMDYAIGADVTLQNETRLSAYFVQRVFLDHDTATTFRKFESGASVLLTKGWGNSVETEALFAHSFNGDYLFRPQISWNFEKNWRLTGGLDIFGGTATGMFGRFGEKDRVHTELRYVF